MYGRKKGEGEDTEKSIEERERLSTLPQAAHHRRTCGWKKLKNWNRALGDAASSAIQGGEGGGRPFEGRVRNGTEKRV